MLYEYLLTAFKVVVGLITNERLIYAALAVFGIYLLWVCIALACSFQRKFYRNSIKLYNSLKKCENKTDSVEIVNKYSNKLSNGFLYGWRSFQKEKIGKPSNYINRQEVLDIEINGGILNQGKSFMRAFIWLAVSSLFLFNLAFIGQTKEISCYVLAESMVLPLILLFVLKIFYFLFTTVKQQLYKSDVEIFYDLIDLIDEKIGSENNFYIPTKLANENNLINNEQFEKQEEIQEQIKEKEDEIQEVQNDEYEDEKLDTAQMNALSDREADDSEAVDLIDNSSLDEVEEKEESASEEKEEEQEEKPVRNLLDEYDIFKKKNIDVNKLMSEVPSNSSSSLPFIDVDSDYVISDNDSKLNATKPLSNANNGSEILGGMIQDGSSIKKSNFINTTNYLQDSDLDNNDSNEDKNKEIENNSESEKPVEENKDTPSNSEDDKIEKIEIDNAGNIDIFADEDKNDNKDEKKEDSEEKKDSIENNLDKEDNKEEKTEEVIEEQSVETNAKKDENIDDEQEKLATLLGGYKTTKKSTLASGGMVIERNRPIERKAEPINVNDLENEFENSKLKNINNNSIETLETNENTDEILNSLHGGIVGNQQYGNFDNGMQNYQPMNNDMMNQMQQAQYDINQNMGQAYNPYNENYMNQNNYVNQYMQQPQQFNQFGQYQDGYMQNQNIYGDNYNSFNQYQNNFDEINNSVENENLENIEEEIEEPEEKPKAKKVLKKKEIKVDKKEKPSKEDKKVEEKKTVGKRGRPKKQVFDEEITIKDEKEFEKVLSRAEKLMRKSDEGLSQSQSKRIEKELKMLIDAMNVYKEKR